MTLVAHASDAAAMEEASPYIMKLGGAERVQVQLDKAGIPENAVFRGGAACGSVHPAYGPCGC